MAQQNIDFGSFPDDPSADAIRTAFQKVQNNFNELFSANADSTVTSINRTPGAGITVNYPTGNVVISANIACLLVATTSLKVGRGADNTQSNVTITSSSQQLNIDIDPNQVLSNTFSAPSSGLANLNGTLTSNSFYQPNINTIGTLTSLTVSGNANVSGNASFNSNANFTGANINFSNVSNLHIQGGTLGYYLQTDGTGNLSWAAGGGGGNGSPGGVNTSVQFNDEGSFGANTGFTFNKTTGVLTTPSITVTNTAVIGNLQGSLSNGNSNVNIPVANGNVNISAEGNANVFVVTGVGANILGNFNVSDKIVANRIEVNLITGTLTTNAQPNITSTGTLSNLTITGNVSAGNADLGNLTTSNYFAGVLTTAGQPNITSTGTLTSLSVSGNANVGNLNVTTDAVINGNLSVLGNATYINIEILEVQDPIISLGGGANGAPLTTNDGKDRGTALQYYTTAPVTAFMGWDNSNSEFAFGSNVTISSGEIVTFNNLGNVRASYFIGANTEFGNANLGNTAIANFFVGRFYGNANAATVANTVVDNAQPNITSVGTLTSLAVTGNTTSANFVGKLANGNSNISITADSNINLTSTGNTTVVITGTGINTSGTGNFTGNLSAANLIGPLANGNSNVNIPSSNGNVVINSAGNATLTITGTGANINGYANVTGNANVGALTVNGISSLGDVANVRITGGNPIDVLVTVDGTGNLAWGTIGFESIYNGNSNVSVTANGNITMYVAGNTTARFTATTTGIVANGTLSVSGNTSALGIKTDNYYYANGDVISFAGTYGNSNVATFLASYGSNTITTTGNVSFGNIAGTLSTASQPNITSVGRLNSANIINNSTGYSIQLPGIVGASTSDSRITTLSSRGTLAVPTQIQSGDVLFTLAPSAYTGSAFTGTGRIQITATDTITASNRGSRIEFIGIAAGGSTGTTMSWDGSTLQVDGAVGANSTITGTRLISNVAGGTAPLTVTSTTRVANLNVATSGVANTVNDGAQGNITSVGTLTSLSVSGNITAGNISATNHTGTTANITGQYITTLATGTAPFVVTSTTQVANLSVATAGSATTAGTVTTAAQGNITSLGTLTGLSVSGNANIGNIGTGGLITATGNISGANVIVTGYHIRSVGTGITAAGTTQGGGTALTKEINIVSTVASGATGVVLPTAVAGMIVTITNTTANSMIVYPASGGQINGLGTNAGFTQGTTTIQFVAPTTTQWYTVGATYA